MVDIKVTPVRLQWTINTPFRVVTLFVGLVLAAIIVINGI